VSQIALHDLSAILQTAGSVGQLLTAGIAVSIAVATFRHQRRQSRMALINESNALANIVNATVINQPAACAVLGRLRDPIVGCPDDAVLFMYLNWAHNMWRNYKVGAMRPQVWEDTLAGCIGTLAGLRRDQVVRLVSRGYERKFQDEVLARYDVTAAARPAAVTVLQQAA
jgi:hypothetical protein